MIRILSTCLLVCITSIAGCAPKPVQIRVLTYNIHHGEGTDRRFDLPRIAQVIKSVQPDLVALQEVDQNTQRASGVDQAAELGRLTDMHAVFGKAMDYSGGGYGEAALSRWPIVHSTNHALPATSGHEPRSAISIDVQPHGPKGPTIRFVGTHLDHTRDPTNRLMQVEKLNGVLLTEDAPPTILVGDLNATSSAREMQRLLADWTDAAVVAAGMDGEPGNTIPSRNPRRRIDYVLVRPMISQAAMAANAEDGQDTTTTKRKTPRGSWRVIEARVIAEEVASDHRPVFVVLEWLPH